MTLQPETQLGPYQILSPLGAGGMGEVYKAKDTRLNRWVAIKVLPEHISNNPVAKQRFERESVARIRGGSIRVREWTIAAYSNRGRISWLLIICFAANGSM